MGVAEGISKQRMLDIEAASVVGGQVTGDNLVLTRKDGSTIQAGNVRGPQGIAGTNGKNAMAGSVWDNGTDYVVDNIVGYAGRLWRAIAPNKDACPPFNLDKWTALTGMDAEAWSQNDPYFSGNNLNGWEFFWRGGNPAASLTTTAGEFETGQQALKIRLAASETQRLYEREENLVRGGEIVTVHVRARLSAAATGLTLKGSLFQAPSTGSPQPFGSGSSEPQSDQGTVQITSTSWQTYTFTIKAVNAKPRARVNLLFEQDASGSSTILVDRVRVSRLNEARMATYSTRALLQNLLTGGGIRRVYASSLSWSQRFIIMGMGQLTAPPWGYFDVTMPPDGTVIPVYGKTGTTSQTVTGGRIQLYAWQALYYDVPMGNTASGMTDRFKIVDYLNATTQDIPPTWVMIVHRNEDSLSPTFTWGDGQVQDIWKDLPLASGYTAWASNKIPQYRLETVNRIKMRGFVKPTTGNFPATTATFATMPAAFLPDPAVNSFVTLATSHGNTSAQATGNTVRVEMNCSSGIMYLVMSNTYQAVPWVSLDEFGYSLD